MLLVLIFLRLARAVKVARNGAEECELHTHQSVAGNRQACRGIEPSNSKNQTRLLLELGSAMIMQV